MTGWVEPLAGLSSASEPQFGGKAAGLGRLLAQDIPVPPGFAVATDAFDAHLDAAGLRDTVDSTLDALRTGKLTNERVASAAIVGAVRGVPVPGAVRAAVQHGYDDLATAAGCEDPPVAVRSSARGEDARDASFAGQQETYLWVRGVDAVCAALRDCWASLYSPEAIAYRKRLGSAAPPRAAMGVVVQLMIDAEVSGVMFTCSPITHDPSVVAIDASWGLGLGVVGGDVTPDNFVASKITGEILRRSVAHKPSEHRPDPAGSGTVVLPVAEELRDVSCLDDERIAALVQTGRAIDARAGERQDVEWAFARGGELFVLQARPVTTGEPPPPRPPADVSAVSLVLDTFGARSARAG